MKQLLLVVVLLCFCSLVQPKPVDLNLNVLGEWRENEVKRYRKALGDDWYDDSMAYPDDDDDDERDYWDDGDWDPRDDSCSDSPQGCIDEEDPYDDLKEADCSDSPNTCPDTDE